MEQYANNLEVCHNQNKIIEFKFLKFSPGSRRRTNWRLFSRKEKGRSTSLSITSCVGLSFSSVKFNNYRRFLERSLRN